MAMTQQQRDAKTNAKREAVGEVELRHRVRPGVRDKLAEIMAWHEFEEQAEAIQTLILNVHALGPQGSAALLALPRHEFQISESVARALEQEGQRQAARLDRSEE